MNRLLVALVLLLAPSASRGENPSTTFRFPTLGNHVDRKATLLAIDDDCLPLKKNLCYYLSKPTVRAEPVLTPRRDDPGAPDHVAAHFYGTVLREHGKFRMWYYGLGWLDSTKQLVESNWREGPICYAESDDGVHWTRPNLGQVLLNGSRDNNGIALPERKTEGAFVIRDDQDPDPRRRYKMVYENQPVQQGRRMSARTATSPDGIVWTAGPDSPIKESFEPCAFYQHEGMFIINAQRVASAFSEGGHNSGRQGFVWLSTDFNHWLEESGESFALPEPENPNARGLEQPGLQVHLGTAPVNLGNVLVGLYCRWNNHPNPRDWFGFGTTSGDFGLAISHDGQHFREPVKGHVFLQRNDSAPHMPAGVRFENILCQGNGIVNVGDETWIYHGRWANTEHVKDYYAEIALATLPRDRWGALGLVPGANTGSLWSAPIRLPREASRLLLNADGARGLRIEIADEKFRPLPRFSGEKSGTCAASKGLERQVQWPHADLADLADKTVRLRIHFLRNAMVEPRLYACYLTCADQRASCDK